MDKLSEIFRRQAAYVRSLKPTYLNNGFYQYTKDMPWDLDGRKTQEEFRLLAWRCTEEVIEAMDSWEREAPANTFYREEVADALHFLIELCLATGISEDELVSGVVLRTIVADVDRLDLAFSEPTGTGKHGWYDFIRALAFAMMQLRQRPWRTDDREADRKRWVLGMYLAFRTFVDACKRTGITAEDLHSAYFAKAKINDERRESFGCQPA